MKYDDDDNDTGEDSIRKLSSNRSAAKLYLGLIKWRRVDDYTRGSVCGSWR